jgi:hypothetical protein
MLQELQLTQATILCDRFKFNRNQRESTGAEWHTIGNVANDSVRLRQFPIDSSQKVTGITINSRGRSSEYYLILQPYGGLRVW